MRRARTPMAKKIELPGIPLTPPSLTPAEGEIVARNDFAALFADMLPDEQTVLLEMLIGIAARILRRHGPVARHYAKDAEDYANEAVLKALRNERAWPDGLPLLTFLAGIVSSDINHDGHRPEHTRRRAALTSSSDGDDSEAGDPIEEVASNENIEANAIANVDLGRLIDSWPSDLREFCTVRVVADGSTARQLACIMAVSVQRVHNLERQLARRKRDQ